jgi:hypothetical protein
MGRIGHLVWAWFKSHAAVVSGFVAGAAVAVGILILIAVVGTRDISQAENSEKVAHDWRRAMMALGIRPVFPPSEDFHVGDVIAFDDLKPNEKISDDGNGPSSLLFRTMGIAHVPGTEEALRKRYQDIPQFPPTPEKYDGISPVAADRDIFTAPDGLKSLPIVGFPGITIATASVQTASLGVLSGIRAFFSGATRTTSESVQIKIPEAETYGVGAQDAHRLLSEFCKGNFSCTQAGVREALSLPGDVADKVDLYFITRVYLTRSIDYEYGSDTAVAAAVRAVIDRSKTGQEPPPRPQPGPQTPTATQTPEQTLEAARTQVIQELGGVGQGGQLTSASTASAGVVFKMRFARPVVIGYAAISISPFPDPEPAKLQSASPTKASAP